jgi:two-component system sensor histidine kinase PilS (NtrC family)
MVITLILGAGFYSGLVSTEISAILPDFAALTLIAYIVFAAYHVVRAHRKRTDFYRLARLSMVTDIFFLSLLLLTFGGLEHGVGILLVFTSALSAILLPLRIALFLASIASLTIIGHATWDYFLHDGSGTEIIKAGLYGVTAMVSGLVAHRLAYWARDFRLIAEKQRATLTKLEQVNELIIHRMRTGVIALDPNNKVKVMNEAAWFLLGSPSIRQRDLGDFSPRLSLAIKTWQKEAYLEPKAVLLEPTQAQVLPNFVPLPSEMGTGILIILNDSNVVARRAAELSANSLAKLSSSIAHEIRNPLAAVTHAAQLLEESSVVRLPEMRLINIIQNQSARMNGIIENILQLSRREQSRPELLSLNDFLRELANEVLTSHSFTSVEFEHDISNEEAMVVFDRSQLSQCIWKLLDNAVAHVTRANSQPLVNLIMETDVRSSTATITVMDNGPGIAAAQLGNIFEPFYTTRKEGSGLGLYIARQLCEANQAELTVDSEVGHGASFRIRLGLVRGSAAASRSYLVEEPENHDKNDLSWSG